MADYVQLWSFSALDSLYQRVTKHKSYPVSGIVLKGFSILFFSYFAANELLGARPNMALDRRKSHTGVSMGIRGQQHRGSVSHQITQGNDKKWMAKPLNYTVGAHRSSRVSDKK